MQSKWKVNAQEPLAHDINNPEPRVRVVHQQTRWANELMRKHVNS